jgi:hypothetical protein
MTRLHRIFTSPGCILAGAVLLAILVAIMAGEGQPSLEVWI